MKTTSFLTTFLCTLTLLCATPVLRAEGDKPAEKEKKSCCEAAAAASKKCPQPCCVKAAEAGKACEKCQKKG